MRLTLLCLLITAFAWVAPGQEFEVVSVKPSAPGSTGEHTSSDQGMLRANNLSLKSMIASAYGMRDYQVEGPAWLESARFDLAAKFPEELPKNREKYNAALNAMMQKMLVERFKLAVHRDRKNLAVYGLVVGKHGIKMKEVPDGDSHSRSRNNHYEGSGMTMAGFAGFLSRRVDLPVLDMTGLKGFYELTLDWVPEARPGADRKGDVVAVADSATGPTIFIALEEQLGLKLETRKAPVEMLVVDRAEKLPTEN